jgi:hypothetical protein
MFVDRRGLLDALRSADHLYLASDGGAANQRGSFGALLATCFGSILIKCGGRALGADPRSFRAEGYGILAILWLALHLRHFYITGNPSLRFQLYCDSKSLLKRIEASRRLSRTIPHRFLFSEVDVEMQIISVLQAISTKVLLDHVEGHQDTKYPDEPLSWAAQLNMRCDEIATLHLETATTPLPTVTYLPASHMSLSIGPHTVTHHIQNQLRTFAGLPGLRAHLYRHHSWDSHLTFDLIDWPIFHQATLTIIFLRRLFTIKWISSLLPFQHQQFSYQQSPSANCPSACGCYDEDWKHFPMCPHPQRERAWKEFQLSLSATMNRWEIDPSLRRILLHMISPLLHSLTNLADEYLMLLTTQRLIGEDSLLFFLFQWIGRACRTVISERSGCHIKNTKLPAQSDR